MFWKFDINRMRYFETTHDEVEWVRHWFMFQPGRQPSLLKYIMTICDNVDICFGISGQLWKQQHVV